MLSQKSKIFSVWNELAKLRGFKSIEEALNAEPTHALAVVVEKPELSDFLKALQTFLPRARNKEAWWRSWDKTLILAGRTSFCEFCVDGVGFFGPEKIEKVRVFARNFRFMRGRPLPVSEIARKIPGEIVFLANKNLEISFPKFLVQLVHGFFGFYYLTGRWGKLGLDVAEEETLISLLDKFPKVFPRIDGGRIELEPGTLTGVVIQLNS